MTRPIPPPVFDPVRKAAIAEKYKDLKPASSTARPTTCICQWHSPEPGVEVRIATNANCTAHAPPPTTEGDH